MPGNPLVRFDEGRVDRTDRCRPLSYSTEKSLVSNSHIMPVRSFSQRSQSPAEKKPGEIPIVRLSGRNHILSFST